MRCSSLAATLILLPVLSSAQSPSPPAAPAPETAVRQPRLLVADLAAQGVTPAEAAAMTDAVVVTLEERAMFEVLSRKDVEAVLSAERRRQLLGTCQQGAPETDSDACAADLGGALGARFALSGSLSKLGDDLYQLTLQVLDTVKAQRVGRSTRLAKSLTTLRLQLPYAVAEATGTPLPPPPSRILQYSLIAGGAASVIGGGMLGILALGRQATLADELCPGGPYDYDNDDSGAPDSCSGTGLRPKTFYEEQNRSLGAQKTWSLALMVAGAAAAGAGLYLMPPPEGGPRVALVPSASGVALVGVFE